MGYTIPYEIYWCTCIACSIVRDDTTHCSTAHQEVLRIIRDDSSKNKPKGIFCRGKSLEVAPFTHPMGGDCLDVHGCVCRCVCMCVGKVKADVWKCVKVCDSVWAFSLSGVSCMGPAVKRAVRGLSFLP